MWTQLLLNIHPQIITPERGDVNAILIYGKKKERYFNKSLSDERLKLNLRLARLAFEEGKKRKKKRENKILDTQMIVSCRP